MFPVFPHENSVLMIDGPSGQLELMTTWPDSGAPAGVGVICHPDPRQEGTMHNKVVTTLARAFSQLNLATVRFNFRGVGGSEGQYGEVQGELADLRAVIAWVKKTWPEQPLWLAGFSFGSYISALAATVEKPVRLISIAPPVNRYDFGALKGIHCPWLIVQGDQDEIVPFEQVNIFAKNPPVPVTFIVMPGVTHFFHGRLIELREHVVQWGLSH